jgi:hypothetical protein
MTVNGTEYLSECALEDMEPFTLEEFGTGRQHASFKTFFRYFVPAVVAKNKFKSRLLAPMSSDSHMCTVSDEACTLLLLENCYDRWVDVHKNKMEGSTSIDLSVAGKSQKRKRRWESDVSPKYTNGGIRYSDDRRMSHKGWKDEGIRRFNVLCHRVSKDRKDYPAVLTDLVRTWKEDTLNQSKRVPNDNNLTHTEAYHELWADDPEPADDHQEQIVDTAV